MTAILTLAMRAYSDWSIAQSKVGDPSRRPNLTRDAFYAGWQAALEAHPARDDRKPALHGQISLGALETDESAVSLSFTEAARTALLFDGAKDAQFVALEQLP